MNDRERDIGVSTVIAAASSVCSGDRVETFKLILQSVVRMAGGSADPSGILGVAIEALQETKRTSDAMVAARSVPFTPAQQDGADGH